MTPVLSPPCLAVPPGFFGLIAEVLGDEAGPIWNIVLLVAIRFQKEGGARRKLLVGPLHVQCPLVNLEISDPSGPSSFPAIQNLCPMTMLSWSRGQSKPPPGELNALGLRRIGISTSRPRSGSCHSPNSLCRNVLGVVDRSTFRDLVQDIQKLGKFIVIGWLPSLEIWPPRARRSNPGAGSAHLDWHMIPSGNIVKYLP